MKALLLLILVGVTSASVTDLGDRIVAAEQECDRIYKLNDNWRTKKGKFQEQLGQYIDLYLICLDGLNEDKYAYIDNNNVDMSLYAGENDKFPIETTSGTKFVTKPPTRTFKEAHTMKQKLLKYLTPGQDGGIVSTIHRILSIDEKMSQEIIDKQVECEYLALEVVKHSGENPGEQQHTDCINELNCLKEKFMKHHGYNREDYPVLFPILYKRRGTMIKTPPKLEHSACEVSSPEAGKGELAKWLSGIEYLGEKLGDIGETGTDFIHKLLQKGTGVDEKVLSREELDEITSDAKSVKVEDVDKEDKKNQENTYMVDEGMLMKKLAELEAKGINTVKNQLDKTETAERKIAESLEKGSEIAQSKLNKVIPAIETAKNVASLTGEKLKEIKGIDLKPAVQNTVHTLNDAESELKERSKNVLEEVKDGLAAAESVTKMTTTKLKEEGSILLNKIKSNVKEPNSNAEEQEKNHETGSEILGGLSSTIENMAQTQYLPDNYDKAQLSNFLQVLQLMGGKGFNGIDNMTDDEIKKTLKSLKETARKQVDELHLSEEDIKKSAETVKYIMHFLLSAASKGYGAAKNMSPQEIEKAKSIVDEMVGYATAELLDIHQGSKEDEDEDLSDEDSDDENDYLPAEHSTDDVQPKNKEPGKSKPEELAGQNLSKASTDQEANLTAYESQVIKTQNEESAENKSKTSVEQDESTTFNSSQEIAAESKGEGQQESAVKAKIR